MTPGGCGSAGPDADDPLDAPRPPRPTIALAAGGAALVVVAVSAWLAVKPGAEAAQTALVLWFDHPPPLFAAVLGATNPLARPVPLAVVSVLLVAWILLAAAGTAERLELVRALVVALTISELGVQLVKQLANQPRPLSVIVGLDNHGYPTDPHGNSYPSAHTSLVVAAVVALWPWLGWPQRVVGLTFAVLVGFNRLYIGAHWPLDVVGGAAVGVLAGTIAWLVAGRWPIARR